MDNMGNKDRPLEPENKFAETGQPAPTTQRHIAAALGVTQTTVSKALRNHPEVSAEMREEVLAAARAINYQPDPILKALTARRWRWDRKLVESAATLAFLDMPRKVTDNPYDVPRMMVRAAAVRAAELGYHLEDFTIAGPAEAIRLSRILFHRGIRGLLIFSQPGPKDLPMDWAAFSTVCFGTDYPPSNFHSVTTDWYGAVRLAARQAWSLGYRRPGYALLRWGDPGRDAPISATASWERDTAVRAGARRVPILHYDTEKPGAVVRWFHRYRPDCVIGSAVSSFWALHEAGVRMPEETGFITLQKHYNPNLPKVSAIDIQPQLIAARAIELLNSLIHLNSKGPPDSPVRAFVEGKWVPGETVSRQPTSISV